MFVYEEDIQVCLSTLQKGGLILYPTDTVLDVMLLMKKQWLKYLL